MAECHYALHEPMDKSFMVLKTMQSGIDTVKGRPLQQKPEFTPGKEKLF